MTRVDPAGAAAVVPAQAARLPVIIDTDIGGEPDDAMSLVIAARELRELALVVTSDEMSGQRARFARHLLDCLHRPDVRVVAGRQLSATPNFFAHGLTPAGVAPQPDDVGRAVADVAGMAGMAGQAGGARWIGLGPLSNLAETLARAPGLGRRLIVTQLGGLAGEDLPQRNFRLDPLAADAVLRAVPAPPSSITCAISAAITAVLSRVVCRRFVGDDMSRVVGVLRRGQAAGLRVPW